MGCDKCSALEIYNLEVLGCTSSPQDMLEPCIVFGNRRDVNDMKCIVLFICVCVCARACVCVTIATRGHSFEPGSMVQALSEATPINVFLLTL